MNDLKERIEKLHEEFEEMKKFLDLDSKKSEMMKLEAASTDPNLWNDQDNARKILQGLSDLKDEISEVETTDGELATLIGLSKESEISDDFASDIGRLESRVQKLKVTSLFIGEFDTKNAILSLHAGQGGTEAMDWTSMLFRMYMRFCERKGWKTTTLDISEGEEAGIKSVTVKIEGKYAYGNLKCESGTHRLVRQSPFNADKLRQTSFSLVEVLPEFEATDLPGIEIKEEDLEWSFFRSSGKGGQNVQKVSTAVRLKHIPTGITVSAQTERFQVQNRKYALEHLRALLWIRKKEEEKNQRESIKGEYRPASWGNQIRSYVLHPYKMVKDLRTEYEVSNPDSVLDGELEGFIEAELKLPAEY
jgi:peptide chain release factor 2